MLKALGVFKENLRQTRELGSVYDYLIGYGGGPMTFDDLLRSQIVYGISAFDKLMHDVIRIGIVDTFIGKRTPTPKYLGEKVPLSVVTAMNSATVPPKEIIFEQYISSILRYVSYQDPDVVSDGLSYIWSEQHKWQRIAASMGADRRTVKTELRLIVDRRNSIVHEADIDLQTGVRRVITKTDSENAVSFLEKCAEAIVPLVK
jgi:hypothetical protein